MSEASGIATLMACLIIRFIKRLTSIKPGFFVSKSNFVHSPLNKPRVFINTEIKIN